MILGLFLMLKRVWLVCVFRLVGRMVMVCSLLVCIWVSSLVLLLVVVFSEVFVCNVVMMCCDSVLWLWLMMLMGMLVILLLLLKRLLKKVVMRMGVMMFISMVWWLEKCSLIFVWIKVIKVCMFNFVGCGW